MCVAALFFTVSVKKRNGDFLFRNTVPMGRAVKSKKGK